MKTLIVKYIPRNEQSNTKKLLDAYKQEIINSDIEELDLLADIPDMMIGNNLIAYVNRSFMGQTLLPDEEKLLSKMDRMAVQLQTADIVVIVFPMFNFSMPAIVKAWVDSVIQNGITFGKRKDNGMAISNEGKKALTLVSTGGIYSSGSDKFSEQEHAISLIKALFQFLGYTDVRGVLDDGLASNEEVKKFNLNKSISQVRGIAKEWYMKNLHDPTYPHLVLKAE